MATWGLIVEMTVGTGERKHSEAYVLAHVEGAREEALAELERRARRHFPEHPRSPKRRRLFRYSDGFLLVVDGAWQSYSTRFTLAELLEDSAAPVVSRAATSEAEPKPADAPPTPTPTPAPAPAPAPEERYADGVPVKPSWLGRPDLP
ncbi:hypothetical protein ACFXOM_15420 [Streptomyces sp. NPDC059169]|uniref:hypothetical protein n=1 Tax=Streptomyces sp. NPDC059169 TaxID=3346754 RepID=UPI00368B8A8B